MIVVMFSWVYIYIHVKNYQIYTINMYNLLYINYTSINKFLENREKLECFLLAYFKNLSWTLWTIKQSTTIYNTEKLICIHKLPLMMNMTLISLDLSAILPSLLDTEIPECLDSYRLMQTKLTNQTILMRQEGFMGQYGLSGKVLWQIRWTQYQQHTFSIPSLIS